MLNSLMKTTTIAPSYSCIAWSRCCGGEKAGLYTIIGMLPAVVLTALFGRLR